MLGLSLQKLLVLALIVAAIWYGFKWLSRLDRERKARLREGGRDGAEGDPPGAADLVQCALCEAYVPADLGRCPEGRADCPHAKG